MSKVINFNARNFEFDSTCESNVGFRGFVTTALGNEEVWEIGNWNWDWTQIRANFTGLEKNMDYVFRFAMTLGHNDDNREESLVHIHYTDGDEQAGWDDRFTYCIRMSRFQPIISKRNPNEDTMIRVFELPFNTGDHSDFRIIIVSQHAVARFFTARENAAYEGLEDLSYAQWREQRTAYLEKHQWDLPGQHVQMVAPEIPNMMGDDIQCMIESAVEDSLENAIEDAIENSIQNSMSGLQSMIEERIKKAIQESLSQTKL